MQVSPVLKKLSAAPGTHPSTDYILHKVAGEWKRQPSRALVTWITIGSLHPQISQRFFKSRRVDRQTPPIRHNVFQFVEGTKQAQLCRRILLRFR